MTKIKICGLTRVTDAVLASELGAAAVGLVFWERSPRYVEPTAARAIVAALPPDVAAVGVFVDSSAEQVREIAAAVGLSAVQLHGDETVEFCRSLPYRVLKAVGVRDDVSRDTALALPAAITVLLDAHDPTRKGGTGRTIDWSLAAAVAARRRVFLSGGIGPENVAEAIATVRPYAVDVSSGVEVEPGVKDEGRLRAFFEAVQTATGTGNRPRRQKATAQAVGGEDRQWQRQTRP